MNLVERTRDVVSPFRIPSKIHEANACILWCSEEGPDKLLDRELRKFIEAEGFKSYVLIKYMGGAKSLVSPNKETDRIFPYHQIKAAAIHRNVKVIVLMTHSNCEAYGGLAAFTEGAQAEFVKHVQDLEEARRILKMNLRPDIDIILVFVDQRGFVKV